MRVRLRGQASAGAWLLILLSSCSDEGSRGGEALFDPELTEHEGPCPSSSWNNCEVMTDAQRDQIEAAFNDLGDSLASPECGEAMAAMMSWLEAEDTSNSLTFESHDSGAEGAVLHSSGTGEPSRLGIRQDRFGNQENLFRVAIHEGAHLAGYNDDVAYSLQSECSGGGGI